MAKKSTRLEALHQTYPYAISNWENNWDDVNSFFQFPEDIRRIMYTTYTDKKTMSVFFRNPSNQRDDKKNIGIVFSYNVSSS